MLRERSHQKPGELSRRLILEGGCAKRIVAMKRTLTRALFGMFRARVASVAPIFPPYPRPPRLFYAIGKRWLRLTNTRHIADGDARCRSKSPVSPNHFRRSRNGRRSQSGLRNTARGSRWRSGNMLYILNRIGTITAKRLVVKRTSH